MELPATLCPSCTGMNSLQILETGELPVVRRFTLSSGNGYPFCRFCIEALRPEAEEPVDDVVVDIGTDRRYHITRSYRNAWTEAETLYDIRWLQLLSLSSP